MKTFEEQVQAKVSGAILYFLANSEKWLTLGYFDRFKIPQSFLDDVWRYIESESLKKEIAARVEAELADRVVNQIVAELSSDIKQILSVQERREAVRAVARENLERIMSAYDKGYAAYYAVVRLMHCPLTGRAAKAWMDGWRDARDEAQNGRA